MSEQNTALARRLAPDTSMLVPKDIAGFYDFADDYYRAGLVPSSYKSRDQVAIAMIKGHEFGMLPAQSVDAFYVIGNRACPFGRAFRGLVQSSGNLLGEQDGYAEGMDELAFLCDEPNPHPEGTVDHELTAELQRALRRRMARVKSKNPKAEYIVGYSAVKREGQAAKAWVFDSYEAQKMGLLGKSGPWSTTPGRMCMHRAATFLRSDVFSDRLTGLDITAEEAMDVIEYAQPQPGPASAPPAGPAAVLRDMSQPRPTSARHAPVDVDARPAAPVPADPPPPPATGAARADIYAGLGNPAPASDIPEDPEVPLGVDEANMAKAPGADKPKGPTNPGAAALKAAVKQVAAAGLDAAAIGKEAVEAMMGVGVQTKDLSDSEKGDLARAMLGKLESLQGRQPGDEPDEAEF